MAKKNIRNYVPGQNDFLHFAEVMNKNAEMDMKKNNSQVTGTAQIPTQSTSSISSADGQATEGSDASIVPVEYPEAQADATDEGVTNVTGELLSEQEWYESRGLDPDADYQNTVNALTYDYQTSLANYGENAEKLYQMGLSNGGVSDIFGANAYSAYISAMNDARINYINTKKNNKLLYGSYRDQYESKLKSQITDAFNSYAATYTDENADAIRQALSANGMSQAAIDQAISEMQAYQNSLPEGQRAVNRAINEIYDGYVEEYDPSLRAHYELILSNSGKYSDANIQAGLDKLDSFYNSARKASVGVYVNATKIQQLSLAGMADLLGRSDLDDERLQNAAAEWLNKALDSEANLQNAWNFVGVDQTSWQSLSDGKKILEIIKAAGEYKKKGLVPQETVNQILADWFGTQIELGNMQEALTQLQGFVDNNYSSLENVSRHMANMQGDSTNRRAFEGKANDNKAKKLLDMYIERKNRSSTNSETNNGFGSDFWGELQKVWNGFFGDVE